MHPVRLSVAISIHTPTQGVTENIMPVLAPIVISIHTPTQGVTAKITIFFPNMDFCLSNINKLLTIPFTANAEFPTFHSFLRCEPLWHFMSAYHPHRLISLKSLPLHRMLSRRNVPPSSDNCFQDNKNAGCLLPH